MGGQLLRAILLGDMPMIPTVGVAICGAVIGGLSMLCYAVLSPQEHVARLSTRIVATRSALRRIDESDMRLVWSLTSRAVRLSLRQISLILVPTLCAAVVMLAMAWLVDVVFDLSNLSAPTTWRPSWLFS